MKHYNVQRNSNVRTIYLYPTVMEDWARHMSVWGTANKWIGKTQFTSSSCSLFGWFFWIFRICGLGTWTCKKAALLRCSWIMWEYPFAFSLVLFNGPLPNFIRWPHINRVLNEWIISGLTFHFKSWANFSQLHLFRAILHKYMVSNRAVSKCRYDEMDISLPKRDKIVFVRESHHSLAIFLRDGKKVFENIPDSST